MSLYYFIINMFICSRSGTQKTGAVSFLVAETLTSLPEHSTFPCIFRSSQYLYSLFQIIIIFQLLDNASTLEIITFDDFYRNHALDVLGEMVKVTVQIMRQFFSSASNSFEASVR